MTKTRPWWRSAIVYQIYVRSWRDSDGDGTGDLTGVIEGLEYLQWLGVECIWLSPTMPSPNTDWGYDVSDYVGVHPDLGTLDDMKRLVEEARQRGIAVMLDLVPNHTSDKHAWFIDALSGPDADHRNYYVWAGPRADGTPPNNWRDATGASAWTLDEPSGQYYLHNFLKTQPDLNWWEPRVHDELEDVLRFWFDLGICGFRVDVAHGLYKDDQLRDNPLATSSDHPEVQRGGLRPEYSSHRPEVHPLYQQWRQICDGYQPQRALLGETWEFDPERFGDFYGRAQPELHMAFNFTFVMAGFGSRSLADVVEPTLAALPPGATPVWTASNHDVGRFPSRWCGEDPRAVRAALLVMACLPGTLVLYYGDELGMVDVDVPVGRQLDEMTMGRPGRPTRDRCRTPMPWSGEINAGFTAPNATPWLPLGDFSKVNVHNEQADPGSILHFCRRLNQLRRQGSIGEVTPLERVWLDDQVWAFRTGPVTTIVNLSPQPASCQLPAIKGWEVVVTTSATGDVDEQRQHGQGLEADLELGPWEGLVARLPG